MGVPGFYKWLTTRYPNLIASVTEKIPEKLYGEQLPVDASPPNPNGIEFDNLYIDMNGIIHPCCHPEGDEAEPKTEDEMIERIFRAVDRIFAAVRPRKLLYLAIDGTAPRAKMNQQRSRRFRSARERKNSDNFESQLRDELMEHEIEMPKSKAQWDSNVITPGTKFMDKVAEALEFYIHERISNEPAWQNIVVMLSDSNEPGEGEHKIVEFIRSQRMQSNYDPHTHHVLHGLDADLIMLALATHEINFTILREKQFPGGKRIDVDAKRAGKSEYEYQPMQMLHISILREYLQGEFGSLATPNYLPFPYNFENVIDDFIFLCFFIGNDFLPHLPSLSVYEGAIENLMDIYKRNLPRFGGYLTHEGFLNYERVRAFLYHVGSLEDGIFIKRMRKKDKYKMRQARKKVFAENKNLDTRQIVHLGDRKRKYSQMEPSAPTKSENISAAAKLKAELFSTDDDDETETIKESSGLTNQIEVNSAPEPVKETPLSVSEPAVKKKKLLDGSSLDIKKQIEQDAKFLKKTLSKAIKDSQYVDEEKHPDLVKFGIAGWKERYFRMKLKFKYNGQELNDDARAMFENYIEGLAWVMQYYFQGCPSWSWYYKYHYAPFASDLYKIEKFEALFQLDKPVKPLTQLMCVFPPDSAHALPKAFQDIMFHSEMSQYYPPDFKIDLNGARVEWKGVVLLPFIDIEKLMYYIGKAEETLSEEEKDRNSLRRTRIFWYAEEELVVEKAEMEPFLNQQKVLYQKCKNVNELDSKQVQVPGVCGSVHYYPRSHDIGISIEPPFDSTSIMPIEQNLVFGVHFILPEKARHHSKILPTVTKWPVQVLSIIDQLDMHDFKSQEQLVADIISSRFDMSILQSRHRQRTDFNQQNHYNQPPRPQHQQRHEHHGQHGHHGQQRQHGHHGHRGHHGQQGYHGAQYHQQAYPQGGYNQYQQQQQPYPQQQQHYPQGGYNQYQHQHQHPYHQNPYSNQNFSVDRRSR